MLVLKKCCFLGVIAKNNAVSHYFTLILQTFSEIKQNTI